jgi:hypothetical protein
MVGGAAGVAGTPRRRLSVLMASVGRIAVGGAEAHGGWDSLGRQLGYMRLGTVLAITCGDVYLHHL